MSKPAILFVMLQTDAAANGGIASISNVIAELRDHRPVILTNVESDRVRAWRKEGVEVHIVPEMATAGIRRAPLRYLGTYLRYHHAVRTLLRQSGARVIHANDPMGLQLALSAANRAGAKIVLNLRDTLNPDRKVPRARYRFLFAAVDHIFYLSNDMARRWSEVAPNALDRASVTYSIVNTERFAFSPLDQAEQPPTVLLTGIVSEKKGHLDFIRHVAPTLAAADIRVSIAGDFDPQANPYHAACAAAARPLGDQVRFLGYRSDVPALLRASSVVVVASKYEGLVRAMVEAMSSGRPVVSFAISSAREILEEQGAQAGTVVDVGDHDAMAAHILRYCRDGSAAAAAGVAGAEISRRIFTTDSVVTRYEEVYHDLGSR